MMAPHTYTHCMVRFTLYSDADLPQGVTADVIVVLGYALFR